MTDIEKGEARVSNGSSHFQFHNIDLQRASSKGSVLSSAGKVYTNQIFVLHKNVMKIFLMENEFICQLYRLSSLF